MGTSVILVPTIEKTRQLYPNAELFFIGFKENVSIFQVLDLFPPRNILSISTDSFFYVIRDTLRTIFFLRKLKVDILIDLEFFSRYTAIFSYFTGAKTRVGFHRFNSEGLYRGDLMTHKVPFNYYLHIGQSFLSLIQATLYPAGRVPILHPIPLSDLRVPKLIAAENAKGSSLALLKSYGAEISDSTKIVIMSPNTGEWLPYRKWPIENYVGLSQALLSEHQDIVILITGTQSAVADANFMTSAVADRRLIDLTCKTSLVEFINLLHLAHVIVSVDSGPAHFACLTKIGIVCIFGPDTQVVFAPLSEKAVCLESGLACHPCFSPFNARTPNCNDKNKPCLQAISIQKVKEEVDKFLRM
ncbi:MAG TPA: glycosyltransferase family 9 protein [Candidatus Omnitrophota bacterium]|nr:glycosyltransferase family 9 protein [Candidatus Omnitrophota bacterium]